MVEVCTAREKQGREVNVGSKVDAFSSTGGYTTTLLIPTTWREIQYVHTHVPRTDCSDDRSFAGTIFFETFVFSVEKRKR